MDDEKIYSEDEIQPLMKEGWVFCTTKYREKNEIWWDKEQKKFLFTGVGSGHIEDAMGCLSCGTSYVVVRKDKPKRCNPWSA